jgi:hypothetical protein
MQKNDLQKRLAERKRRVAAKKGTNNSGGSFISELSPALQKLVSGSAFDPILKDIDGEPKVIEKNSSDEDEIIKVKEIKMSPVRYADKNYSETNFNEISAINNTTIGPDTSMNTS